MHAQERRGTLTWVHKLKALLSFASARRPPTEQRPWSFLGPAAQNRQRRGQWAFFSRLSKRHKPGPECTIPVVVADGPAGRAAQQLLLSTGVLFLLSFFQRVSDQRCILFLGANV
ncbi:hypothetical protein DL89DRAFT_152551 [Linderina pennispora]|uniref:Uncharacterized protein n=1 Tax=Linderina pennispora TaxID=61395 RepID=A0A1Y1WA60_9FUNG|nr:uncharacterized protein DL89DRAFT_152551 [Linderina pennispora]ORX70126.1 hypothetical protein DL89DRAFT_152551 [Linderina pennispora]